MGSDPPHSLHFGGCWILSHHLAYILISNSKFLIFLLEILKLPWLFPYSLLLIYCHVLLIALTIAPHIYFLFSILVVLAEVQTIFDPLSSICSFQTDFSPP